MSKIFKLVSVGGEPVVLVHRQAESEALVEAPQSEPAVMPGELLEIAGQKADTLLRDARQQAEQCLAQADEQAEKMKREAYDTGHAAGYQEGVSQGRQEAGREMQQAVADANAKAERIIRTAEQEAQETVLAAERTIVEIALAVAGKVLIQEIKENPMSVLPVVKAALEKVKDQENIEIRVNPDEFEQVVQSRKDLEMLLGREKALKIMPDQTIVAGGCVIDTAYGTVDAKLDSQFEMVKKALQEVLP
ncbi:FliH/SctL family protein [Lucifera butyrica]|uniref:FliH/SctL family protein n=1 Tax=Lucifera butyrica TaxID=1351585 RepID=UPI0014029103|nr:FliH/SctL family protein [Lucifera butyrica]